MNEEILNIVCSSAVKKFDESFIELLLNLHGYTKHKFDDCYIYRSLINDKSERISIIRYDSNAEITAKKIQEDIKNNKYSKTIIISQIKILSSARRELKQCNNLIILDPDDMVARMKEMLNEATISQSIYHDFILPQLVRFSDKQEVRVKMREAEELINGLKNCEPGGSNWKKYESLCYRAIKYLFEDTFSYFRVEYQVGNDIKTDIRDLVVMNNGIHDFWKNVKQVYNCNNIVMEFKNYSESINNESFRQISDYLEKDTFGQCGILFTRKELNQSARKKQIDYLHNRAKKLIIVVTDSDLIDMINLKSRGESPEKVLMDLKFTLETST